MEILSSLSALTTAVGEGMEAPTAGPAAPVEGNLPGGAEVAPEAVQKLESALTDKACGEPLAPVGDALSPADLYQAQFAMSMFKLEGTGGSKGSQQLTQDVENVLKQQG